MMGRGGPEFVRSLARPITPTRLPSCRPSLTQPKLSYPDDDNSESDPTSTPARHIPPSLVIPDAVCTTPLLPCSLADRLPSLQPSAQRTPLCSLHIKVQDVEIIT